MEVGGNTYTNYSTHFDDKTNPNPSGMQDLRCYSASYASSSNNGHLDIVVANGGGDQWKFKKGKSTNGAVAKSWSFNDPEVQRKKRVASYKAYTVEDNLEELVQSYITWDDKWNLEKLEQNFRSYEVDEIRRVPTGGRDQGDSRYWKQTSNGEYTVKSGYKVASERTEDTNLPSTSNKEEERKRWKRIWAMNLPPRIKIFAWKLMHDFILTEGVLAERHIPVSPKCKMCGKDIATMVHALFTCDAVKSIWKDKGWWSIIKRGKGMRVDEIILAILDEYGKNLFKHTVTMLWGIWKDRTNITHMIDTSNGKRKLNMEWVIQYVEDYEKLGKNEVISKLEGNSSTFPLLKHGTYYMKSDASYNEQLMKFGIEFLIYKKGVGVVEKGMEEVEYLGSVKAGELLAILRGLQTAVRLGYKVEQIYTDSMEAVMEVNNSTQGWHPEGRLAERIRRILRDSPAWSITHIPRKHNKEADKLARRVY